MSKIEELEAALSHAHEQAAIEQEAGDEYEAYAWRQEARAIAQQLDSERIERPFTAYENEYGDYSI